MLNYQRVPHFQTKPSVCWCDHVRPLTTSISAKALWTSITSLPGRSDLAVWDLPRFGVLRKCPKVGKKNQFKLWFQYVSLGFLKISKVFRPFDAFWKVCWKRNALEKPWRQLPMKQDKCKQLKLTPSRDFTRALGLVQVLRCLRGLGELFRLEVWWNPLVLGGPLGHFGTMIPLGPIFRLDILSCAMYAKYRNLLWCIQPPAAWRTSSWFIVLGQIWLNMVRSKFVPSSWCKNKCHQTTQISTTRLTLSSRSSRTTPCWPPQLIPTTPHPIASFLLSPAALLRSSSMRGFLPSR